MGLPGSSRRMPMNHRRNFSIDLSLQRTLLVRDKPALIAVWTALALADCARAGVELEKALRSREHTVGAVHILRRSCPSECGSKEGRRSKPKHPGIVQRLCGKEQPIAASVRDKREAVHVHKAEISDLEVRDHRQGQKSNLQKGFGPSAHA